MSFSAAIRSYILADATLSGLIGTKVFPHPADPETEFPYVTTTRVNKSRYQNLSGGHSNVCREEWQIDVWSNRNSEAEEVEEALIDLLDTNSIQSMDDPDNVGQSFQIYLFLFVNSFSIPEETDDGSAITVHRRSLIFTVKRSRTSS